MLALAYDGSLRLVLDQPLPVAGEGDAVIRVTLAGICNTDVEILRGYADFQGILGHEFVGVVEDGPDRSLIGKRVAGEINIACGHCRFCLAGMPTHCACRTVLGIRGHPGAFAEYLVLPQRNLHVVPDGVADEDAVFTEPLAAALEILQQVHVHPDDDVIVLGDGKLGLLVAQVLRLTGCALEVVGKHPDKLVKASALGVRTVLAAEIGARSVDIVVDCTGQPSGFELARALVRPRGVIVLKSTFHGSAATDLSLVVVDEVTIVGSRCGPFAAALRLLGQGLVQLAPLVSATYPLADAVRAMKQATVPGVLKVLIKP